MDIQNLVRERVIGNIKIGMKGENGLPKKLSYFNVEEDKSTNSDMVDIFKQLYPNEPTKLKIRFTTENPFNFKFKRYVNNKVVCIGNGKKAITVGKDNNGKNSQIEVECTEQCQHRLSGKCKLKGSLKFKLEGIEAGGVWNLSTTGGISLSNIASEIVKYKKANMSIVDVPFELTLTEQQSLAYGTYYSIDLHRTDIKPQLINDEIIKLEETNIQENKQLNAGTEKEKVKTTETKKTKTSSKKQIEEKINDTPNNKPKEDFSNYFVVKAFVPTVINKINFNKIIFEDTNGQDVEYILHPRANQELIQCGIGTLIEIKKSKLENDMNILCEYDIKQVVNKEESITEKQELKEAV